MKDALFIASTHAVVNKHNKSCLQSLRTQLHEIEAINSHCNIPNFKPKIDHKKQTVESTKYLQTLQIKLGCRVMLTDNLDVQDSLCNGSLGMVCGFIQDRKRQVKVIMVKFDNKSSGKDL